VYHTTQYPVTGLSVPINHATVNIPFTVSFSLTSGSSPSYYVAFGNTQLATTYDNTKLTGTAAQYTQTTVGVFWLNVTVWNLVSLQSVYQEFQVGAPVTGVNFSIITPYLTDSKSGEIYPFTWAYATTLNFFVNIASGANVQLDFYTGEENTTSPTYTMKFTGAWPGPQYFNYTYSNPLEYFAYVNVSNLYNSVVVGNNITIMTNTSNIVAYLKEDPVVYTVLGTTAYYQFSFYGNCSVFFYVNRQNLMISQNSRTFSRYQHIFSG
jgi:hypothetical protein